MASIDEQMNSVMLSIIRRRTPSADVGDFEKPIYDLDMDSLDVVDLSQALEKEFGVRGRPRTRRGLPDAVGNRFLLPRTDRLAMTAGIVDIVTATPGEHIDNSYFDSIGLTDEWIRRRTGVGARWWIDPDEPLEDVGAQVCAPLVARHRERVNIAALIVVSCSTGGKVPGIAQRVAKQSGLPTDVLAFDVNAACSGFVYGVISGLSLCQSGGAVIVCAVEAMSRLIDKSDRNTGCLFGDGAGAVLIESRPTVRRASMARRLRRRPGRSHAGRDRRRHTAGRNAGV